MEQEKAGRLEQVVEQGGLKAEGGKERSEDRLASE